MKVISIKRRYILSASSEHSIAGRQELLSVARSTQFHSKNISWHCFDFLKLYCKFIFYQNCSTSVFLDNEGNLYHAWWKYCDIRRLVFVNSIPFSFVLDSPQNRLLHNLLVMLPIQLGKSLFFLPTKYSKNNFYNS